MLSAVTLMLMMMVLLHQFCQPGTTVQFLYLLYDLVPAPLGDEHDPHIVIEPTGQQDGDADDAVAGLILGKGYMQLVWSCFTCQVRIGKDTYVAYEKDTSACPFSGGIQGMMMRKTQLVRYSTIAMFDAL